MKPEHAGPHAWVAWAGLIASGGTLVCCALPALLVTIGAGAALSALVSAVPGIVLLSEHKGPVFGLAALLLTAAAILQLRARRLPCPTDPAAARACASRRAMSWRILLAATCAFIIGAVFAFLFPLLRA